MESELRPPVPTHAPAAMWLYSLIYSSSHTVVIIADDESFQASESTIVRPDRAAQLGVGGKLHGHGGGDQPGTAAGHGAPRSVEARGAADHEEAAKVGAERREHATARRVRRVSPGDRVGGKDVRGVCRP